jgi:hypothetical protein
MSGVLRDLIVKQTGKKADDLTRADMYQGGAYFRKKFGGGYVAQACIAIMESLPKEKQQKVIIDGIRHPGEIRFIERYRTQHTNVSTRFFGIVADRDPAKDNEIRLKRLLDDPQLRGEHFENANNFDWSTYIERDMPPYGLMVNECLSMVDAMHNGRILINGEGLTKARWHEQVRQNVNDYWHAEGDTRARRK